MNRTRYLTFTLIIMLSGVASYHLSLRMVSQLYYLKGNQNLREDLFGLAAVNFSNAAEIQKNDYQVNNCLGRAYHQLAQLKPPGAAFSVSKKSRAAYARAAALNPLDAESAFGLAREEARLQQMYARLHPGEDSNPYDPDAHFQRAIQLRPNGIGYHYAYARYLYEQGRTGALLNVLAELSRIYPPAYTHLKKEAFWSAEVMEAVKQGLREAVKEGKQSGEAHLALSRIMADEGNWNEAIDYYEKALSHSADAGSFSNQLHLGGLYIEAGRIEEAGEAFSRAIIVAENLERDVEQIYRAYRTKGYSDEFISFLQHEGENLKVYRTRILVAQTLIDSGRYAEAKQSLNELNQEQPSAEAYFMLHAIAHKENDWDQMELSIQRATVLEPGNGRYHMIFSQVLARAKKLDAAEKEAGLAIQCAAKPSSGLFSHRASIRWEKKDYEGAAEDWKAASALEPENASLHARAAETYANLGDKLNAREYYRKAAELDPENKQYREKYAALAAY